jgi:hypothetical protein
VGDELENDTGGLGEGAGPAAEIVGDGIDVVVDLRDPRSSRGRKRWWPRRSSEDPVEPALGPPVAVRPDPRRYTGPDEIAAMGCEWLVYLGFSACDRRTDLADGIELETARGIARLLAWTRPVDLDAVREVHAAAALAGKHTIVFAPLGFTDVAAAWADRHPTALLAFDLRGEMTAVNVIGRRLLSGADDRAAETHR